MLSTLVVVLVALTHRSVRVPLVVAAFLTCASTGFSQEAHESSVFAQVAKGVALDPTTYAPAIIGYDATMRDWRTSQPFFQHGFLERNGRYTISGFPTDRPLGYSEGSHRILMDALTTLEVSVVNNVASRALERSLITRFPTHPKLVRTLGWIERTAFASGMAYVLSESHYRQAGENARLAKQLGY